MHVGREARALVSERLEEALVALAQHNLNPSEDRCPGQICILWQLLGNNGITANRVAGSGHAFR